MRLSVKLTTGFADPPSMKRGLVIPSSPHTNSVWVPHVRTGVRGLSKTGRSPIKALSFSLFRDQQCSGALSFAILAKDRISRVCGGRSSGWSRGIPPFEKRREGRGTRTLLVTDGVFLLREPHAVHQRHRSKREIRGSSGETCGFLFQLLDCSCGVVDNDC